MRSAYQKQIPNLIKRCLMHAWLKEQVFVPELAAKHYFSIFSIFSFIRLHWGRVHKICKTLGVFCMPVVTKSSLAGPPQRHNIDPKRATDQANKLRPKAASIRQVEAARQDWRTLPPSPPRLDGRRYEPQG